MKFDPRSVPLATRTLLAISVVLSLASYIIPIEYIALIPATSVYYLWTFVTAGLWESNPISLLINGTGLLFAGKYFENQWGLRSFVKYVAIVNVGAYLGVFLATVLEYAATFDLAWLFDSEASGLAALLAGFLVSFKQAVPEHSIKVFNVVSVRAKHLPSVYLLLNFILFVCRIIHVHFFIVLFGTLVSWLYTRFYKRQDGLKGDRSETFSFASFWPDIFHPIVKPWSNAVFKLAVSMKLCPPLSNTPLPTTRYDAPPQHGGQPPAQPGPIDADAERRRALALKALDMRLSEPAATPTPAPSTAPQPPT
ncbi:hypothetical protein PhCBS80983_g04590 [Powellomyces hirtus]|uniref:Peptidase S54 rhomboid domain-containing protein n=1 Tax=Powellomyces hirtus TaxID=109895 RepID=A0A507DXA3_9FUNG|nr:hypothetical protein PhCBS80983_g04590 [Powellomyces hirtus]